MKHLVRYHSTNKRQHDSSHKKKSTTTTKRQEPPREASVLTAVKKNNNNDVDGNDDDSISSFHSALQVIESTTATTISSSSSSREKNNTNSHNGTAQSNSNGLEKKKKTKKHHKHSSNPHKKETTNGTSNGHQQQKQSQQKQPQQQQQENSNYRNGGGYCHHVYKSYEERWSDKNVDMVVQSWNMTPKQVEKLYDFQERVRDVDHPILNDPHQLVFFLMDELGKVARAETFFRKVVAYRKQHYSFDTILTSYTLPDDYDYFPQFMLEGADKEGYPIHCMRTGAADCWNLYQRHGRDVMIHHAIYNMELNCRGAWVDDFEAKHNKRIRPFTVIFDLQGLSRQHMRPGLLPVCGTVGKKLEGAFSFALLFLVCNPLFDCLNN